MKLFLYLIGPRNSRVLSLIIEFGRELILRLEQLDGVVGAAIQHTRANTSPTKHDLFGLELFAFKSILIRYLLFLDLEGALADSQHACSLLGRWHLLVLCELLLVFLLALESDHLVCFELEFVQELLLRRSEAALQILV